MKNRFLIKLIFTLILFPLIYTFSSQIKVSFAETIIAQNNNSDQIFKNAFNKKISNIQVQGQGIVIKLLKDDLEGGKHQRFIVKLNSGQTLLVAHNIDIAPRINSLKTGDIIIFYGEYEWNAQGGVIHWTHRDPQGKHPHGWLKHKGKIYQ
ncbi:DUF3465 domain-containing protein [Geminocystis sp. NIES-3709]|uniref:DUF3465 domain-containing protein n=1 Tax=Geminocystis sp. NIES-3709 TaxID=1617448 RepID=UPI0005FC5D04|nr:DUF3465 domain-containing protein [Geminocystis sp. NIES-3709]BAQ66430.1 hypothetical protein GM3709_3195 [Geminocystis sp. NIES-3709]